MPQPQLAVRAAWDARLSAWAAPRILDARLSAPSVPQLGSWASSGRAWRLWTAQHSDAEAGPLGAQPPPRVLELSASKAADLTAFEPSGRDGRALRPRAALHVRVLGGLRGATNTLLTLTLTSSLTLTPTLTLTLTLTLTPY